MSLILTDFEGDGVPIDRDTPIIEEGDKLSNRFSLSREGTLDDDMTLILQKHKGTPSQVLVQYMIDALIIFRHNLEQLNNGVFGRDGKVILPEEDPNMHNDINTINNKFAR